MTEASEASRHIARNIKAYEKLASSYDEIHGEIFNAPDRDVC